MRAAGGVTGLDVRKLQADFPILARPVRGRRLVYLDNAATTQKPVQVLEAVRRAYMEDCANIHRGVYLLSERATAQYDAARAVLARYIGASTPEELVFVRGTTEAINLVAQSYLRPRLSAGDEVLVTRMEHHSNIVPWQLVCGEAGARVVPAPIDGAGELVLDEFERLIGPHTRMVAVPHVSNALGTVNPVKEIVRMAHERGVPVLVDGAQAVPHGPVDLRDLDADFYAFSGHKMYGPTGIGVLYGKAELLAGMPPWQGGGDMIRSVSFEGTSYADPPQRFEAGTPHIAGAIGLGAAAEYLQAIDTEALRAHEADLLAYGVEGLSGVPGLRMIGTPERRCGVLSFTLEAAHPHDVGTFLDRYGVCVRTGHHCAQPVMEHFGVSATVRASVGLYNTREDIDALVEALVSVVRSRTSVSLPADDDVLRELGELYADMIQDHDRHPRNFHALEDATSRARGHNPLCGDSYDLYLKMDGDKVADVGFTGQGCAISRSSASIMSTLVKGKTRAEAEALFQRFHDLVTGKSQESPESLGPASGGGLGKLAVFAGVSKFPVRVKCATLAWHTLRRAMEHEGALEHGRAMSQGRTLEDGRKPVSTE